MRYLVFIIAIAVSIPMFRALFRRAGRTRKESIVRCVEHGCELEAKGYDIESAWDEENQPIWAIFYECPEGHQFVAEFERQATEAAA